MLRVADPAGFDRVSLFRQSGAGMAGVALAVSHPDRVDRMVFSGCPVDGRDRRADDGTPEQMTRRISQG
jgi:pimeloyl-ACP methyl ester carboxylesterase